MNRLYAPYYRPPNDLIREFVEEGLENYYTALRALLRMSKYAGDRQIVLPCMSQLANFQRQAMETIEDFHGQKLIFVHRKQYYTPHAYKIFCDLARRSEGLTTRRDQDVMRAYVALFLGGSENTLLQKEMRKIIDTQDA